MTLEELNKLSHEAEALQREAESFERAASSLADVRKSPAKLSDSIKNMLTSWSYGSDKDARTELFAVINELKHDLLRIAEMRLTTSARTSKVAAARKRDLIEASIGKTETENAA
jgi:hypothetical protein